MGEPPFLFNGDRSDLSVPPAMDAACWGWQTTDNNRDGVVDYGRLQIRHPVTHVVAHDEHVEPRPTLDELTVFTWSEDGLLLQSSTSWWDTYVYHRRYEYDDNRLVAIDYHRDAALDLYAWEWFDHDDVGRLVHQQHEYKSGGVDFHTWEYDVGGRLAAVEQTSLFGVVRTEFSYDSEGRLISQTPSLGALPTTTYEYPSNRVSVRRDWVECDDGSWEVARVVEHERDRHGGPKRVTELGTDLRYPEFGLGCGPANYGFTMQWEFDEHRLSGVMTATKFASYETGAVQGGAKGYTTIRYDDGDNYVESTSDQWLGPNTSVDVGHQQWTWFCPGGAGLGTEDFGLLSEDRVCDEPAACP